MNLKNLGDEISNCNKCPFNEKTDVRFCGGFGNDYRVMFVAESPSTSGGIGIKNADQNFGVTGADKLFSKIREKHGLGDCYLTDFVKCGIPGGKPTKQKIDNCVEYLKKEIEIIKPKVIVAVGKLAKEMIEDNLKLEIQIFFTYHYSWIFRWCKNKPNKKSEYDDQHKKILRAVT